MLVNDHIVMDDNNERDEVENAHELLREVPPDWLCDAPPPFWEEKHCEKEVETRQ